MNLLHFYDQHFKGLFLQQLEISKDKKNKKKEFQTVKIKFCGMIRNNKLCVLIQRYNISYNETFNEFIVEI